MAYEIGPWTRSSTCSPSGSRLGQILTEKFLQPEVLIQEGT